MTVLSNWSSAVSEEVFKLNNGTVFLVVEAPGGIYNSAQLQVVSDICSQDLAIVKATEDQRLGLFAKEEDFEQIKAKLGECGLGLRHYQHGVHQAVSCVGELCPEHEQDALGSAMEITKCLNDINLNSPLKVGVNGCFKCCTPCHTLDISVVGETNGYRISLGGKTQQLPELASFMAEAVPADKLPELLKKIVELYAKNVEEDESLLDVIERCGASDFVAALSPYSQDAAVDSDPFGVSEPDAEADLAVDDVDEESDLDSDDEMASDDDDLDIDDSDDLAIDDVEDLAEDDLEDISSDGVSAESSDDLEDLAEDDLEDISSDGASVESSDDLEVDDLEVDDLEVDDLEVDDLKDETPEVGDLEVDDLEVDDLEVDDLEVESEEVTEESASEDLDTEELSELSDDSSDDFDNDSEEAVEDLGVDDLEVDDLEVDDLEVDDLEVDDLDETPEESSTDDLEIDDIDLEEDEDLSEKNTLISDSDDDLEEESTDLDDADELEIDDVPLDLDDDESQVASSSEEGVAVEDMSAEEAFGSAEGKESVDTNDAEDELDDPEFSEIDELGESDEEDFESKIIADIDDEAQVLANTENDENASEREMALDLISDGGSEDSDANLRVVEDDELSLDDADEGQLDDLELDDMDDDNSEEMSEPEVPQSKVGQAKKSDQGFKFASMDVVGSSLQLRFDSGAYIEFNLDSLPPHEEKSFSLAGQSFVLVKNEDGVILEIDEVKLFYPTDAISEAS